jgi:hypothetical protein
MKNSKSGYFDFDLFLVFTSLGMSIAVFLINLQVVLINSRLRTLEKQVVAQSERDSKNN